jgi:hypothetical protein
MSLSMYGTLDYSTGFEAPRIFSILKEIHQESWGYLLAAERRELSFHHSLPESCGRLKLG